MCGMMQRRVYRVPIRDMDELRQRLVETWAEFQKSVVDDAINQWRKKTRLEACIRADGGTLISCCDVACLTCKLPRKTDGSYHSGTHHNSSF